MVQLLIVHCILSQIRYFGFGTHKVMIIIRKRVSWVRGHNELPLFIGVHQIFTSI